MKRGHDSAIVWVHPGVRDTVIEYLTEHDAERQRFLGSAAPDGVLLALSTAGRSTRRRLLTTPADWAALTGAAAAIAASGDPSQRDMLLRGINEVLDGCGHGTPAYAGAVGLARMVLDRMAAEWDRGVAPGSAALLEAFYDLSVRIRHLVSEPDVSRAWRQAGAGLRSALRSRVTGAALAEVQAWTRLAGVLQLNQPRFVRMNAGELDECALRIVSWLRDGPGPASAGPALPGQLCPVEMAVQVLDEVAALRTRAGLAPDDAQEVARRLLLRRTRGQPAVSGRPGTSGQPGAGPAVRSGGTAGAAFDIGAFFADL